MSAYIVNNETISVIAKGFVEYGVPFSAKDYLPEVQVIVNFKKMYEDIGQSLLNENFRSVNFRYTEDTKPTNFEYIEVESNEGMLLGCIKCYIYQSCETDTFFESDIYNSLLRLKEAMLERFITKQGQEIPWGYCKEY